MAVGIVGIYQAVRDKLLYGVWLPAMSKLTTARKVEYVHRAAGRLVQWFCLKAGEFQTGS